MPESGQEPHRFCDHPVAVRFWLNEVVYLKIGNLRPPKPNAMVYATEKMVSIDPESPVYWVTRR